MRDWLKTKRTQIGLSQKDMARRLSIAQPYYCEIESGKRQPDMAYSMMEKLATALGVPVQTIIDAEVTYKAGSSRSWRGKN